MSGNLRRASAYAAVGSLSLVAPAVGGQAAPRPAAVVAALPFLAIAAFALFGAEQGTDLFELMGRPGDYKEGRLFGLAGFSLAAAGLAILSTRFGLPPAVFVSSVAVLTVGNLTSEAAKNRTGDAFKTTASFAAGGFIGGLVGQLAAVAVQSQSVPVEVELQPLVFFAAVGAIGAALLRSMLFERDDPLVLLSIALLVWLFVAVGVEVGTARLVAGLAISAALGYLAYRLETASLPGMLTGVLLALLAIVLGGYGWFAMLVTFYGLGGLSSKFRYDEKAVRGIAEANDGARGSGNVLANSAVALVAVIAFAASEQLGISPGVFRFAFAGAVATALADTFSSEFGGLFDNPRLVTTFERVPPGTDGAVTWQGEIAGLVGAGIIASIGAPFFGYGTVAAGVVLAAGFVGMTIDSLLGATVEGTTLGNGSVNFFATLAGALAAGAYALV